MAPSLAPLFSSLRYTPLLSLSPLRTLFTSPFSSPSPSQPSVHRYLLRQPYSGALRECPTPIVLVRAINPSTTVSDQPEGEDWTYWGGQFSERGYTALEVDISAPSTSTRAEGGEGGGEEISPLKAMSTLLASQIRLLAIPFPPILISSGADSCNLAQMYVEDNPASGLVLIDPTNTGPSSSSSATEATPQFTFEPKFPILLLGSPERSAEISQSRLGKAAAAGRGRGGKGVAVEQLVDGPRGEKSRIVS